jgi:hypothetical protein
MLSSGVPPGVVIIPGDAFTGIFFPGVIPLHPASTMAAMTSTAPIRKYGAIFTLRLHLICNIS